MSVQTRNTEAIQQFHNLPNEAGVRLPTACALASCSAATMWRLAKAGKIKTQKVSERVTVFNVGSLRQLLSGEC
jgi:hypothetical protein